ncbi:hypothetical protein GCM10011575_42400 [Microlunatus endophyticus]|uniref:Uncharacterized protein n=1 Tax=Microlunatus endophyticus TaxID=1716077 RepID=A0A917SG77_9ACTN|nr:hypothetical protein [Microlunatus endophyticus]GGL79600.1 hypothetical protein GCM10011575_42400 [Microlunatus endophyticus]
MSRSSKNRRHSRRSTNDLDYRFSERRIRRWTTILELIIAAGAVIGGVLAIIGAILADSDLAYGGLGVFSLILAAVLVVAAWLGGQSLARYGGFLGLLLMAGIGLGLGGWSIGPLWGWLGAFLFALAVIGFRWMRRRLLQRQAKPPTTTGGTRRR